MPLVDLVKEVAAQRGKEGSAVTAVVIAVKLIERRDYTRTALGAENYAAYTADAKRALKGMMVAHSCHAIDALHRAYVELKDAGMDDQDSMQRLICAAVDLHEAEEAR
jgi:hypothetical protein